MKDLRWFLVAAETEHLIDAAAIIGTTRPTLTARCSAPSVISAHRTWSDASEPPRLRPRRRSRCCRRRQATLPRTWTTDRQICASRPGRCTGPRTTTGVSSNDIDYRSASPMTIDSRADSASNW